MNNFKPAYLIDTPGNWNLCWYNTHPQTNKLTRLRKSGDLNRIKDIKERYGVAAIIIAKLNKALKNGYNYFIDTLEMPVPEDSPLQMNRKKTAKPGILLTDALQTVLKKRVIGLADRSISSYRSYITTFTEWLKNADLGLLLAHEFTAEHFQDFIYHKHQLGHKAKNINEYIIFLTGCMNIMRKMKMIAHNPLLDFDLLQENESTLFAPITDDELARIVPALIEYNPRFYLFTRFIALEFIRPYHIARLKSSAIDYTNKLIHLNASTTKNKKVTQKQMFQPIIKMLLKMKYNAVPGNYYLFGKNFEPSKTADPRLSITAAEIWKEIVIDGLGIDKKMYALKHTGSQYYVRENENADLKFLQQQMEHHSMAQTEIYLQRKIVKKVNEKKTNLFKY